MKRWLYGCALIGSLIAGFLKAEEDKNVPWRAQAEVARRGPLVEVVSGAESGADSAAAVASAMQPPTDDSHKWLFTLVVTRNCQWCERARRDFETDSQLKAWVNAGDYTKSWALWQVVQIEDQSQAWRWKDYRPTSFPTLIVQPPVNGSWGDPHAIVFARQGYVRPNELDTAIRKAIQAYAVSSFPRRLAWEAKAEAAASADSGGQEQASVDRQTPPAPPPAPLPPLPNAPHPNVPPQEVNQTPTLAALLVRVLGELFGAPLVANGLLLAILIWHVYRGIANRQGIPLLLDDAAATELSNFLRSIQPQANDRPAPPANRSAE